jgi:hypothetical protein
MRLAAVALLLAACASPPRASEPPPVVAPIDARPPVDAPPPDPNDPWLRGTTHVHAAPSGDSRTPVADVISYYGTRDYDFIVLTDHNRVTDVYGPTEGSPVAFDGKELLVLAGIELTNNPDNCDPPPPEPDGKCRIHVNLLGVTARPVDKVAWAAHDLPARVDKYQAAFDQQAVLGGLIQLNHPNWHWGMTAELLTELGGRGATLVEIANAQFMNWSAGTDVYPSIDALWDAALTAGVTMWGVGSDDAHHYEGGGRYPAGGAWVMVHSKPDGDAILHALATGRFYASTGVELAYAERDGDALLVEVAPPEDGEPASEHVITFIGDGRVLEEVNGDRARWPVDGSSSYVRALVTRDDGARAWVQPVRASR